MLILILGVALWSVAHLLHYIAPDFRARMGEEKGKGPIALVLLGSVVLMVVGYRMADGAFFWGRSPAMVGINNLLMLLAIYLFAVSGMKTRLSARIRHPQLTGFKTWAVAHLLVNGDVASFVLFGGLLAWAVVAVILINRTKEWTPPAGPFPVKREIIAVVATVALYAVVSWIHWWLGYPPFG